MELRFHQEVTMSQSKLLKTCICALVCLLAAGSVCAQSDENRIALVIGNGDYEDDRLDLANPKNDAREIAKTLKDSGFEVIEAYDQGYFELGDHVDEFGQRIRRADVAAFYYAGHGIQYQNDNYLIPTSPTIDSESWVERGAIAVSEVMTLMRESNTHTNLIWLDACRNTPAFGGGTRSAATRGLAAVNPPEQTVVMFATEPGDVALDGDGEHSPFTSALLDNLGTPGVPLLDTLANVQEQVEADTNGQQSPRIQVEFSARLRDFYLVPDDSLAQTEEEPEAAEAQPDARTHVTNGSFEMGFASFTRQYSSAPDASFTVVRGISRTGDYSLRVENPHPRAPHVYRTFYQVVENLEPQTDYKVSFWVQSQASESRGLGLILDGASGWSTRLYSEPGRYEWREYSTTYNTGFDNQIFLRFITENTATLWVDDIRVEPE
jgi:uncharacterized caspase-like protein